MNRRIWALGLAALAMLGFAATDAAAAGMMRGTGTWVLDAQKSDFGSAPAIASGKLVVTQTKKVHKVVTDIAYADGRKAHYEYSGPVDGSDIAVSGAPLFDSVTVLTPDKDTVIRTERKGGRLAGITTATVSKDGKTLTSQRRGITISGPQPSYTTVWNRAKH
jgi:hypothetical protein